jgi:hypothetical protein
MPWGIGDQEMTIGETDIILGFLVLIGFVCALIDHRISRNYTSNGLPLAFRRKLDLDSPCSKVAVTDPSSQPPKNG